MVKPPCLFHIFFSIFIYLSHLNRQLPGFSCVFSWFFHACYVEFLPGWPWPVFHQGRAVETPKEAAARRKREAADREAS